MKLGIICCMQTENFCPRTGDFKAGRNKTGVFAGITENIVIVESTVSRNAKKMRNIVENDLGDNMRLPDYTH